MGQYGLQCFDLEGGGGIDYGGFCRVCLCGGFGLKVCFILDQQDVVWFDLGYVVCYQFVGQCGICVVMNDDVVFGVLIDKDDCMFGWLIGLLGDLVGLYFCLLQLVDYLVIGLVDSVQMYDLCFGLCCCN